MYDFDLVLVYLITYAFCTFCISRFFRHNVQVNIPFYKEFGAYLVYYIDVCAVYIFVRIPMVMLILNMTGLFLLSKLYEKRLKTNILMVIMMYLIMMVSECMAMIFCQFAPSNIWEKQGIASQMSLVFQCVTLALNVQIFKKFKSIKSSDSIPWRCWGGVVLIQFLLVYFMIMLSNQMEPEYLVQATLLLTAVDFIILYIYDVLISSEQERVRNLILMEQKESYLREMDMLLDSQKRVRGIYHDIKNHILVMRSYLAKKNYDNLEEYLERLQEETKQSVPQVYTGQPTVDSILNYKISSAKDVSVKVETSIPETMGIEDYDITVILGNLFDNAIEACNKLDKDKRNISCSIKIVKNQMFITMENPYLGKIQWYNGIPHTQKEDKANHGLGLQNVKRVVEKYNGIMETTGENNIFRVKTMLYLR